MFDENEEVNCILEAVFKKAVALKCEVEVHLSPDGGKEITVRPWAPYEANYGIKLPNELVDSITNALDLWCEKTKNVVNPIEWLARNKLAELHNE